MRKETNSPIFTQSLVDQVYEYLLEQIISNNLSYGDNLNIKELSEKLGISTMPVREAIKRLEYDKIVDVKPRSSCQIRIPDHEEIVQIYEVREGLEKLAIDIFLKKFRQDNLRELRKIVTEMEKIDRLKESEKKAHAAMETDYKFHSEISKLSGNEYLINYHRQLCLHLNMATVHKESYSSLKAEYYLSHKTILESLEIQSPEAIDHLEEHFKNVWTLLEPDKSLGKTKNGTVSVPSPPTS